MEMRRGDGVEMLIFEGGGVGPLGLRVHQHEPPYKPRWSFGPSSTGDHSAKITRT